jgi:hypothetical protein
MLTRTGYLVTEGPITEIKKEFTVRPYREWRLWISLHRLSRVFSKQLRMECAFQDSTELINWASLKRTDAQNPRPNESQVPWSTTRHHAPERSTYQQLLSAGHGVLSSPVWLREDHRILGDSVQVGVSYHDCRAQTVLSRTSGGSAYNSSVQGRP